MNKETMETLQKRCERDKEISCPICGQNYDGENAFNQLCEHFECDHGEIIAETSEKLSTIAQENSQTLEQWRDSKKRELLLKIATERPQLLHEIQCSVYGEDILNREVEMELLRKALKTNTLSSFDAMWLRHPKFEEVYKASREKPEHQPQSGQSTGQDEQFFESPDKMIDITQRTNKRENLSEEDMKKKQLVLILYSLLRKRKQ